MIAYKLFHIRRDGSIGSLFIDPKRRLPLGEWMDAETHPTKGFTVRHGWHCMPQPIAPHLKMDGRAWYKVEIDGVTELHRPPHLGGLWLLAEHMKVLEPA